jgi:hypothetical protein
MAEPTSTYMFFRLLKCSFAHNVTFLYYITIATFQEQQHTCNPNIQPNIHTTPIATFQEHKKNTNRPQASPRHRRSTTDKPPRHAEIPPRHHRDTTETPPTDHRDTIKRPYRQHTGTPCPGRQPGSERCPSAFRVSNPMLSPLG